MFGIWQTAIFREPSPVPDVSFLNPLLEVETLVLSRIHFYESQ
jgi:hypothetical protein